MFKHYSHFNDKLGELFTDAKVARNTEQMLSAISSGIRRYIWLKTLMSVITGVLSYAVLRAMSVDFAKTWAPLIFLLYYIPIVGSVLASFSRR
jgi:AI-2 transport protein TqsA